MNKRFTLNGLSMICCLLFGALFFSTSLTAQSAIATRNVNNTTRCDNGSGNAGYIYGLYILIDGEDRLHTFDSADFIEYDNGTATLSGDVVNNSNPDIQFHVDMDFTGRTFDTPTDSPKLHNCFDPSTSDWYYYTGLSGTLSGTGASSGTTIDILGNAGPAFQTGRGANVTNNGTNFGGCGWLSMAVSSQSSTGPQITISTSSAGTNGDINIDLSGAPLSPPAACDNVTNGGTIGNDQTICSGAAATLSGTAATGGSGAIEYIWLSSTVECPTQLSQEIDGATDATYNPGVLTETTYFVRCSRRAGCDSWGFGESNCVTVEVATQTPGATCNDGNDATSNDVILADGCSCAGTPDDVNTPDCNDITISAGDGSVVVSGLDGAPVTSIQIFNSAWQQEFACFADCNAPTEIVPVAAGEYLVYVKYYTTGYSLICEESATITVAGGGPVIIDNDNDGVPASEDCNDNDASVPATVGSTCNDGNDNTINDVIMADGCTCVGTPNGGGVTDNDNDGVPAEQDCNDNDPSVPAAVGSTCNDGNGNTTNDIIQADGCTCAGTVDNGGTPDCANIGITSANGNIVITGLDGAPITSVQVFNMSWQGEFSCFADCNAPMETIPVAAGEYLVYVKYYTLNYSLVCEESTTITVGGGTGIVDNDNDGIPAGEDCDDNDASIPATVGSTCNDGNGATSNDVIQADGCTCAGVVVEEPTCNKYLIENSTPECGSTLVTQESGVFYQKDCSGGEVTVWQAGSDLMLTENGDGTATIAGSILNNGNIAQVNISLGGYNTTGDNWALECYNSNLTPQYFYTSFTGTVIEEGDIAYTIEEKASGKDFVFGPGANNQSDNSLGLAGWTAGTWASCLEVFASLTPLNAGDTCDDSNADTNNDVIQADGCTCAGTPAGNEGVDLALSVTGDGNEVGAYQSFSTTFTITNEGTSTSDNVVVNIPQPQGVVFEGNNPFNASAGDYDYYTTFNWNVGTLAPGQTETITLNYYTIGAAPYTVYGQVSSASGTDADSTPGNGTAPTPNEDDEAVYNTGNGSGVTDNDNDGVPAGEDCNDNDASVPATVGSSCNDGNANTSSDVILADGCSCAGTPNGGGLTDNDNDGVPAGEDCDDNDASVPATVGSSCNDGNNATENDVILADGCSCEGTPIVVVDNCDDILISEENGMISIGGLGNAPLTAVWVFDAGWNTVFNCSYGCQGLETYQALPGTYNVVVKKLNADWSEICRVEEQVTVEGDPQNDILTLTGPDNQTVNAAPGANTATVTYPTPIASTTCADDGLELVRTAGPASGSAFPIGTTTITYVATDDCGNSETVSFTITVSPQDANLTLTGPDNQTVNAAPGANSAVVTYPTPVANTTCADGGLELVRTAGPASGAAFPIGTTTITYTATDDCGNSETVSFTITVSGTNSVISISCPANITANTAPGATSAIVTYGNASATTNCAQDGLNVAVTQGPASGASFPVGTTTVKYTATDACGGTEICSFTVTVNAVAAPDCEITRIATDATQCVNGENYGVYVQGDFHTVSNTTLTEYSNGTATLTGTANGLGAIHIEFTGRTSSLTPLFGNCFTPSTTDWYYYTTFSGTLGSLNVESNSAHPFQIGNGANNQNETAFGGSGWWNASNGQTGDINLLLSGNAGTLQFDDSCEQPVAGCNLDVLFVVGNTTLSAGDTAIKNRLTAQGYNVTTVDAQWAETSDANGKDLILISSTINSSDLGSTYKHVAVPVMTWESYLYDDMAMTGNTTGTSYDTQWGVQSYTATSHQINGNLSGTFNIFTSEDDVSWGYPKAGSNDAGYIPGSPNKCMIIAYDEDDAMYGSFYAPARRVGFFLRDNNATKLTAKGWLLFDQSIQWLTNCTPANANGAVVQSIENTDTNGAVLAEERADEEVATLAFGIYPNPATDMVNVSLVEMNGAAVIINVYDALGRNIERVEADAAYNSVYRINTSDYKSGMYMISVQTGDAPVMTKQLVILGH